MAKIFEPDFSQIICLGDEQIGEIGGRMRPYRVLDQADREILRNVAELTSIALRQTRDDRKP
jgi:hypothetical protein